MHEEQCVAFPEFTGCRRAPILQHAFATIVYTTGGKSLFEDWNSTTLLNFFIQRRERFFDATNANTFAIMKFDVQVTVATLA
jgi:hypothetical protein